MMLINGFFSKRAVTATLALAAALPCLAAPILLVPDSGGAGRVLGFDPVTGNFVGEIIPNNSLFQTPKNAIDSGRGTLFISDQLSDAVFEFTYGGVYVDTIVDKPTNNIDNNTGIAVYGDKLYVCVQTGNTVQQFNLDGSGQTTFIPAGTLSGPFDIFFDENAVFVTEFSDSDIEQYDLTGDYVAQFVTSPGTTGNLQAPSQINKRANGNYLVVGFTSRDVREYSPDGLQVARYALSNSGRGVCEMSNDKLFVTTSANAGVYTISTGVYEVKLVGTGFQYVEMGNKPDPGTQLTGTVKLGSYVGTVRPVNQLALSVTVNGGTPTNTALTPVSGDPTSGTFTITLPQTGQNTVRVKLAGFLSQTLTVNNAGTALNVNFDNGGAGLAAGDIDGNNTVDDLDLFALTQDFLSAPGSASGSALTDLNGDGNVDDFDLFALTQNFLTSGS